MIFHQLKNEPKDKPLGYMICVEQRNDENQEAILQVNIESIIIL